MPRPPESQVGEEDGSPEEWHPSLQSTPALTPRIPSSPPPLTSRSEPPSRHRHPVPIYLGRLASSNVKPRSHWAHLILLSVDSEEPTGRISEKSILRETLGLHFILYLEKPATPPVLALCRGPSVHGRRRAAATSGQWRSR